MRRIYSSLILLILFALQSCAPDYPYEIAWQEPGVAIVTIESKLEPDALEEITLYLYEDHKNEQGAFMVNFLIPSEYPESIGDPWAMAWMGTENSANEAVITALRIYGTRNEAEKQTLMQSGPTDENVEGKWYYNSSISESVYLIYNDAYDTSLFIYHSPGYSAIHNPETGELEYEGPYQEEAYEKEAPTITYRLTACSEKGTYAYYPDSIAAVQITENGELILLKQIYSFMNQETPVLKPISF